MANSTSTPSPAPARPPRRRWLRVLVWVACIIIILLVAAWFVCTSSAFFKSVVLPRAGKALNADITVSDASISPFSHVILHNLVVRTTGTEPLVSAPEVRLRYSLGDIIRGNIHVDEVTVTSPTIALVTDPSGRSNLDPILQSQKQNAKPAQPAQSAQAKPSKPTRLDIKKIEITQATIREIKNYSSGGHRDITELSPVSLTITNIQNGSAGGLVLSAGIHMENNPPPPGTNALLQAKLAGNFGFALSQDLKPASIQGGTRFDVARAEGALAEAASLVGTLDCNVTATEIKQVLLSFQRNGASLGQIRVSGPFDMEKSEGRFTVDVGNIDKNLLNLAGAGTGIDFGPTTITSTNEIQVAKGGSTVTAVGQFNLSNLKVTRANESTPALDLRADYNVTVDTAASNAVVRACTIHGTENSQPILHGELTSPMQIAWGNVANPIGNSTFNFTLNHLQLADWKAFLADLAPSGDVSAKLQVVSQEGGRHLNFDLNTKIDKLSASSGSNQLRQATVSLDMHGDTSAGNQGTISGSFGLANVNGQFGSTALQDYGVSANYDLAMTPAQVQIRKVSGHVQQGQSPGGTFDLSGTYDRTNQAAQLDATLKDLNQVGLGPFLAPMFADKKLVSVALNGNASVRYDPESASQIRSDIQITNLVVSDPKAQTPATPLEARFQADASLNKQIAAIRQLVLSLTPTDRAKNQLQLAGQVDMSQTNAYQGNLKLTADSLDVTHYYDIFAAQQKPEQEAGAARPQTPKQTPAPNATPATSGAAAPNAARTQSLPFRNFVVDAAIDRFYLHEVEITNLQTQLKLDGGQVSVNPFKLALNGAPVNANVALDLGVPGYKYDTSFNAQRVPLAPLVDTFEPDRKGKMGGTLTAQARINGIGTADADLQKNLGGQFDVVSTNLNLQVVNIKSPVLKLLVNVISTIPELAHNPANVAQSLVSHVTGSGKAGASGGLATDLEKSPIDSVVMRGNIGSGKVDLQQALIQSPAFEAQVKGTVTLADVLTNSTLNLPVTVSLSRAAADKISLVPSNTPTNASYVQLPDFLTITGTVGQPDKKVNTMALVGTAARSASGLVTGSAGQLLHGLGNLGQGGGQQGTNAPTGRGGGLLDGVRNSLTPTNAPGTNQSPLNDLHNLFPK